MNRHKSKCLRWVPTKTQWVISENGFNEAERYNAYGVETIPITDPTNIKKWLISCDDSEDKADTQMMVTTV